MDEDEDKDAIAGWTRPIDLSTPRSWDMNDAHAVIKKIVKREKARASNPSLHRSDHRSAHNSDAN